MLSFRSWSRVLVAAAYFAPLAAAQVSPPATIGLLPDTQYYSETVNWTRYFYDQTNWLASHKQQFNIRFVSHLGDIVDNGASRPAEWDRARAALGTLLGVIPHSVCLGNHDYQTVSDKASGRQTYLANFGPEYHAAQPGFLGSDVTGGDHAMLVELGGGVQLLHLSFQWRPDAADFAWARGILAQHPGLPVMISTHEHLRDPDNSGAGAGRSPAGEDTWTNFIRPEPRIFLVVNGHFHSAEPGYAGEYNQLSLNAQVLSVHEFLSDYQGWAEGGQGYMRLVSVDMHNSLLTIRSFSPTLGVYLRDHNSDMRFAIDFPKRFLGQNASSIVEKKFRQGLNGYTGALDTELRSATPDSPAATGSTLTVAGPGASSFQVLVRFSDLFDPARLTPTDDILLAKLRFNVTDAGSGFTVHRLLRPFSAASTWNSTVGGISPDGVEALATPDAIVGGPTMSAPVPLGILEVDVTRSLRAWRNGEANHGWALIPHASGTNTVGFYSSDYFLLGKPELLVWTASTPTTTLTFRQGEAGYSGAADTEIREGDPSAFLPEAPAILVDADQPAGSGLDTAGLVRFADLFGDIPGRIPQRARITSAVLTLSVTEAGSGFSLHRLNRAWNEWDGWSRFGTTLDLDDTEAMRYPTDQAGRDASSATVPVGQITLDVTESLRAWQAGETNNGWLVVPRTGGTDGLRFATSEAVALSDRPRLVVRHTPVCRVDVTDDGFVDFFDYEEFVLRYETGSGDADFNQDGFTDFFDYDEYVRAYEAGC